MNLDSSVVTPAFSISLYIYCIPSEVSIDITVSSILFISASVLPVVSFIRSKVSTKPPPPVAENSPSFSLASARISVTFSISKPKGLAAAVNT